MTPDEDEPEVCVYCKARVVFGWPVEGEWAHAHGSRWCRDRNGFTDAALNVATPVYHPRGAVL